MNILFSLTKNQRDTKNFKFTCIFFNCLIHLLLAPFLLFWYAYIITYIYLGNNSKSQKEIARVWKRYKQVPSLIFCLSASTGFNKEILQPAFFLYASKRTELNRMGRQQEDTRAIKQQPVWVLPNGINKCNYYMPADLKRNTIFH